MEHRVTVKGLNPFLAPEHGTILIDSSGTRIGEFDSKWSSDLMLRVINGQDLRASCWTDLLAQVCYLYGQ